MALETAQYINSLDISNPTGLDARVTVDDHIRLLKASLKRTFTAVTGEVGASHTELNYTMALSSTAQDQINLIKSGKLDLSATSAYAISAGYADEAGSAINAFSATFATSASFAAQAMTASYAFSALYATTALAATSAHNANSAVFAHSSTNSTNTVSAERATVLQKGGNLVLSAADYTVIGTSAEVLDGAGAKRPVGMNTTPTQQMTSNTALRLANTGFNLYGFAAGITVSIDATTTATCPNGSVWIISNFQTVNSLDITCTGATMYWFDGIGVGPLVGTRTLAPYGWCQITLIEGNYAIVGVGLT